MLLFDSAYHLCDHQTIYASMLHVIWGVLHSIVVNILKSDIIRSKFKLQLCYCVHSQTNAPCKRYEPPYPFNYESNWYQYNSSIRMALALNNP